MFALLDLTLDLSNCSHKIYLVAAWLLQRFCQTRWSELPRHSIRWCLSLLLSPRDLVSTVRCQYRSSTCNANLKRLDLVKHLGSYVLSRFILHWFQLKYSCLQLGNYLGQRAWETSSTICFRFHRQDLCRKHYCFHHIWNCRHLQGQHMFFDILYRCLQNHHSKKIWCSQGRNGQSKHQWYQLPKCMYFRFRGIPQGPCQHCKH